MKRKVSCVLAVILAATCLFGLGGCSSIFGKAEKTPTPMLYMDGDDLYMAVGENTVLLDGAAVQVEGTAGTLRGEFSDDNRYLYYLADVSEDGAGTLMAADTKTMTTARIADDVYIAKADGSRILYFTDAQPGSVGTLNVAEASGGTERIADSVMGSFCGFSKDGKNIYYTTMTDSGDEQNPYHFELYIKVGSNQAVKRLEANARGDSIMGSFFGQIVLGNDGALLFTRMGTSDEQETGQYVLTLNADGNVEEMGNALIEQTFDNPDDFLYSADNELYYKAPGAAKVRLSDDYFATVFPPYYREPSEYVPDKRFLLLERKTGDDGTVADKATLYEQEIGKDKVKIISADPDSPVLSPQFDAVCFTDGGKLYLMVKKSGKWSERISICDYAMGWIFDRSGKNLYYIEKGKSDATDGDLMRYRLSDGQTGVLLYDATQLYQTGAGLFCKTDDGDVVWMDGNGKQQTMPDGTTGVLEAKGGYYAAVSSDAYDLIYYKTGAAEGTTLCYNASAIVTAGGFATAVNINIDPAGGGGTGTEGNTGIAAAAADSELIKLFTDIFEDLGWYWEDYQEEMDIPYVHMDTGVYTKSLSGWIGSADAYTDTLIQSLMDCYGAIQEYETDKTDTAKRTIASDKIEENLTLLAVYLGGQGTDDVQPSPTDDPVNPSPAPTSTKGGLTISMAPSGRWETEVVPNTTVNNGVELEQIDAATIVFRNNLAYFGSSMNSSDDIIAECEAWKAGIATYVVGAGEITFTIDAEHNDLKDPKGTTISCQYDGSTIVMNGTEFTKVSEY